MKGEKRMRMQARVKKDRWGLIVLLIVSLCIVFIAQMSLVYGGSGIDWLEFAKEHRESMEDLHYRLFMQDSKLITVNELGQVFGEDLLLPTWMPSNITLKQIYLRGNDTAILACSVKDIKDHREGDVTIVLQKSSKPQTPEELEQHVKVYNEEHGAELLKLVNIGCIYAVVSDSTPGFPVTIHLADGTIIEGWEDEPQPTIAYFWYRNTEYTISGFISVDDIIKILQNMETLEE